MCSEKSESQPGFVKLAQNEYYFPVPARRRKSSSRSESSTNTDMPRVGLESMTPVLTSVNDFNIRSESDAEGGRNSGDEERLTSFKDSDLLSSGKTKDDSGDEWEESLLYIDLDDIPSVNELFAVEPDDFLTFQSKSQRELPKAKKETVPELKMKMYNLDSSSPVLQIGTRYYLGKYDEPLGSALIFQKKGTTSNGDSNRLPSIVPEPVPPRDRVFHEKIRSSKNSEYELVANVSKVLKMSRKEVRLAGGDSHQIPSTPGGLPLKAPTLPYGYNSASSLFTNPTNDDEPKVVSETLRKPGPVGPRSRPRRSSSSDAVQEETDTMEVDEIRVQQPPSRLQDQDSNTNTEESLAPERVTFGILKSE
ncbi:unnamed protein product [Allacma fusca]|uniref:Transcription factor TFIIIC triple barrel domain-containing protein n=1 Tax=Allacma fusca TaxID=39272 RepID=A0A8J2LJI2_9HEXA|nr:unnamed protein product [Allacma fusca]